MSDQNLPKYAANEGKALFVPMTIRMLPAFNTNKINKGATTAFSPWFLQCYLNPNNVKAYTNGCFVLDKSTKLPTNKFMTLDNDLEPFGPQAPGQHGAKITPVIRRTPMEDGSFPTIEDSSNFPLFQRVNFGTYTRIIGDDKVGFDTTAAHVPDLTKKYWAKSLKSEKCPEWTTTALKDALFPRPAYAGALPSDLGVLPGQDDAFLVNFAQHANALSDFEVVISEKTARISEDDLMQAMNRPATEGELSLPFKYEYLKCVGYDHDFYSSLVEMQAEGPQDCNRVRKEVYNEKVLNCGGGNRMYKDKFAAQKAHYYAIQTPVAPRYTDSVLYGTMTPYVESFGQGASLPPKPPSPRDKAIVAEIEYRSSKLAYYHEDTAKTSSTPITVQDRLSQPSPFFKLDTGSFSSGSRGSKSGKGSTDASGLFVDTPVAALPPSREVKEEMKAESKIGRLDGVPIPMPIVKIRGAKAKKDYGLKGRRGHGPVNG